MGMEAVQLLDRMSGVKVLCLGDIMLDRFVYGSASRISPEAPVPVVHVSKQVHIPGGVGNVILNLAAMRIHPVGVAVVGDDAGAELLAGLFTGVAADNLRLVRDPDRPTIIKTRILAGIQQVVRFDEEMASPLPEPINRDIIAVVEENLPRVGAVAVSDYGKGVVNPALMQDIIRLAAAHKRPVAIDPKGFDYSKYAGADLVKPNRKELGEAVGGIVDTDQEVVEAGRSLMARHRIKNLLVTLSDKGMLLFLEEDGGANPVTLPSKAREVFDVTGAGDTVLAGMTASMAIGAPLHLGARLATLAAGVVVGKVGTAVARVDEIVKAARDEENGA
ncbi:MAG: PfkB family carbohydrate kinase [Planctomycetaceae bacterium]|nr:PfkB family carbohydrate kinase [Planctomycetaceae bacterium]